MLFFPFCPLSRKEKEIKDLCDSSEAGGVRIKKGAEYEI
jgi:hypothetical protein